MIPSQLADDLYTGFKTGFKRAPFLWSLMSGLWVLAGLIYFFVYPQLAQASDMKRMDTKVDIVLRIVLEQKLKDLVRVQCDGPDNAWWTLENQIRLQKEEYQNLTAKSWTKMPCDEARR